MEAVSINEGYLDDVPLIAGSVCDEYWQQYRQQVRSILNQLSKPWVRAVKPVQVVESRHRIGRVFYMFEIGFELCHILLEGANWSLLDWKILLHYLKSNNFQAIDTFDLPSKINRI